MRRTRTCCLMLCMILFLTGCGADGGGQDQAGQENMADDLANSSAEAGDGQADASNDPASSSSEAGDKQTNTLDDPIDDSEDRQVLTVVVAMPFRNTLDRIIAYNESSSSYYIDARLYGGGMKIDEVLETQLTLEILSGSPQLCQ